MSIVEAIFGWKDRVYSRFVSTSSTPPQDDDADDANTGPPAKRGKDIGSSFKSSVKKAVIEAVCEARLANSPDDDVRLLSDLTTQIASLHDKAAKQIQKTVDLYDLASVATSTFQDTVHIIRHNSPRMLTPDERSHLAEQTICDWIRGVSHRPHCLFPTLHALKVASGHTRGLGLDLGGELISCDGKRSVYHGGILRLWERGRHLRVDAG